MAWYSHGIAGKNGDMMLYASKGITEPTSGFYNLTGGRMVGSCAVTEQEQHDTLLCTTASGTQIYLRVKRYTSSGVQMYNPTETVTTASYYSSVYLKKGDRELQFGSDTWSFAEVIAGENSIYNCGVRRYSNGGYVNGRVVTPNIAYPLSGASGGGTQQIAMTVDAVGAHFWEVGFHCITTGGTEFSAPCKEIGRIPVSALTNPLWFDEGQDGIGDVDYYNGLQGVGGGDFPVDYEYNGDNIDFPDLPSGASAIAFGRMKLYHPTAAQLNTILDVIWTDPTPDPSWDVLDKLVENFTKWLYKPEKYLVSLMLMPINITGSNEKVYLGKYDTMTTSPAITSQWQVVDCGSLTIPLKSNTAFDFAPYVKTMIYLPYVGFRPINVNEIMGGTIYIKYYVDMFTGSSLCFVKIANQNSNTSVLYTYECNIAQQIPITGDNYNNVINSLISASLSLASKNMGAAAAQGASAISGMFAPDVETSGKLNPNTGALGNEKPYVVIHFPVQSLSTGFVNQNGYPSTVNTQLSNLSGYTEVEKIHLEIPGATQDELDEIQKLLADGVIL